MLYVPDIVPIDKVAFFVGLIQSRKYFILLYVKKLFKSEITSVQKYTFNKKHSEESSRNVCSADLEDSLGKKELYLREIKNFDV